jgi:anaerobic selenocysteine-containing dehydrogenase
MPTISRRNLLNLGAIGGVSAITGAAFNLPFRKASAQEASALLATEQKFVYTACVMCPAECGLAVNTVNGVGSAIYGNPHVPYSAGTLCSKGAAGLQLVYSPDRLKNPMIRVGARGEGKFKRVSWPEAISYIADKLTDIKKKFGAQAAILDAGDVTDRDPYYRIFYAYGTPNCVEHGAICDTPRRHGPALMFGGKRIEPDVMRPVLVRQSDGTLKNDYSYQSRLIIYAGWNPFTATRINYESRGTVEAKLAGAKIIVIDPALTNTASQADTWLPIRPGTDADLFGFMLRYILEHHSDTDPTRRYIDNAFRSLSVGWEEFEASFRAWWDKTDPVNGMHYFTAEWAVNRTGLERGQIEDLAHTFGITKPAALICGMGGIGHHYNGYVPSILAAALNIVTGNMEVPGGAIDTELVKSNKGGSASGEFFVKRPVTRMVNGQEVKATQEELHLDSFGDWPAAWDGVVGDYPRRFMEGVTLKQGPFRGYQYPIKAYFLRTGNTVITGSNTAKWVEALTAKEKDGSYKVELLVYIDTPFLESGMYADVILPEASYLERMSLADVYPVHQVLWLRDFAINKQFESKTPFEIMQLLAKALADRGDPDIKAADFWERYKTEEDFWNEALAVAPGRAHCGEPLPYPNLPKNYTLYGTPDSLEAGRVKIDDKAKVVRGEPLTVKWLREHHGVAVWPMSWHRYQDGGVLKTGTKKIEFKWDWTETVGGQAKRNGKYSKYNRLLEESGSVPPGIHALGWERFPSTFFWFETHWNPYTNPAYTRYREGYPFQLTNGRIHQTMTGTYSAQVLSRISTEDLWEPMGEEVHVHPVVAGPAGIERLGREITLKQGEVSVGVIQMNRVDGERLHLKSGDLVTLETPLGQTQKGRVKLCETIRPGVLRVPFGGGGRFAPGAGTLYYYRETTVSPNALVDPNTHTPIMGMPGYIDVMVKVTKA